MGREVRLKKFTLFRDNVKLLSKALQSRDLLVALHEADRR